MLRIFTVPNFSPKHVLIKLHSPRSALVLLKLPKTRFERNEMIKMHAILFRFLGQEQAANQGISGFWESQNSRYSTCLT